MNDWIVKITTVFSKVVAICLMFTLINFFTMIPMYLSRSMFVLNDLGLIKILFLILNALAYQALLNLVDRIVVEGFESIRIWSTFVKGYIKYFKRSIWSWTAIIVLIYYANFYMGLAMVYNASAFIVAIPLSIGIILTCMLIHLGPVLLVKQVTIFEGLKYSLYLIYKKFDHTLRMVVIVSVSFFMFHLLPAVIFILPLAIAYIQHSELDYIREDIFLLDKENETVFTKSIDR